VTKAKPTSTPAAKAGESVFTRAPAWRYRGPVGGPERKRNNGVDMLRGLAILSVILLHVNIRVPFHQTALGGLLSQRWNGILFWSGFYGVAMFFVISGYVITHSALKKWSSLPQLRARDFYAMRFARIMPLLVALLIVLTAFHLLEVPRFVIKPERVSLGRALFAALTFHVNWLEIKVGYLPGVWDILWSLSIEEVFYLGFPLLCLVARKEWHFVAVASCFLLISPWARVALYPGNELGDRNHLAFMDGIAIGCFTALAAHRVRFSDRTMLGLLVLGIAMVVFVLGFRSQVFGLGLTKNGLYITVLSLGTALILLWMHFRHARGKATNHALLGWLAEAGRYSYEIYLTHMFVVFGCWELFRLVDGSDAAVYVLYLSTLVVSYGLGAMVARSFSNPVNAWLRRRWVRSTPRV
jgi:peptidoglycan/LPS O-acetylase OafA/YrhL